MWGAWLEIPSWGILVRVSKGAVAGELGDLGELERCAEPYASVAGRNGKKQSWKRFRGAVVNVRALCGDHMGVRSPWGVRTYCAQGSLSVVISGGSRGIR
jgi:hypothetical protein